MLKIYKLASGDILMYQPCRFMQVCLNYDTSSLGGATVWIQSLVSHIIYYVYVGAKV